MKFRFIFLLALSLLLPAEAQLETLSKARSFQIVRMSPEDRAAVARFHGGELFLIKEGLHITGLGRIAEIAADRVVVADPDGICIFRIADDRQRVEYIRIPDASRMGRNVSENASVP
jgi:hypothetical protein